MQDEYLAAQHRDQVTNLRPKSLLGGDWESLYMHPAGVVAG
jgi:hypothetical protein